MNQTTTQSDRSPVRRQGGEGLRTDWPRPDAAHSLESLERGWQGTGPPTRPFSEIQLTYRDSVIDTNGVEVRRHF